MIIDELYESLKKYDIEKTDILKIKSDKGYFKISVFFNDYFNATQIRIIWFGNKGQWSHNIIVEETPDYIKEVKRFVEMEI